MDKKMLICGSIVATVMLILMPSIPAIQQETIEDGTYNNCVGQFKFKDVKEIKELEQIKHPFLYFIVCIITSFRFSHGWFLYEMSTDWPPDWRWPSPDIQYPLLYLRALMLLFTTEAWFDFWILTAYIMGWNWNM